MTYGDREVSACYSCEMGTDVWFPGAGPACEEGLVRRVSLLCLMLYLMF